MKEAGDFIKAKEGFLRVAVYELSKFMTETRGTTQGNLFINNHKFDKEIDEYTNEYSANPDLQRKILNPSPDLSNYEVTGDELQLKNKDSNFQFSDWISVSHLTEANKGNIRIPDNMKAVDVCVKITEDTPMIKSIVYYQSSNANLTPDYRLMALEVCKHILNEIKPYKIETPKAATFFEVLSLEGFFPYPEAYDEFQKVKGKVGKAYEVYNTHDIGSRLSAFFEFAKKSDAFIKSVYALNQNERKKVLERNSYFANGERSMTTIRQVE